MEWNNLAGVPIFTGLLAYQREKKLVTFLRFLEIANGKSIKECNLIDENIMNRLNAGNASETIFKYINCSCIALTMRKVDLSRSLATP